MFIGRIDLLVDTIDLLINEYDMDVYYCDIERNGTVLHYLVDICARFEAHKTSLILDYLLDLN